MKNLIAIIIIGLFITGTVHADFWDWLKTVEQPQELQIDSNVKIDDLLLRIEALENHITFGAGIYFTVQGGTGTSTVPTWSDMLIGNGANSRYDVLTLTAGTNMTIATTSGNLTFSSSPGFGQSWHISGGVLTATTSQHILIPNTKTLFATTTLFDYSTILYASTTALTVSGQSWFNGGFLVTASSTATAGFFVPTPTVGTHAANKDYVDHSINTKVDFFFTDTASDITDLGVNTYVMVDPPSGAAESSVASSTLKVGTDDQLVFVFAMASSTNPLISIPIGSIDIHFHAERTSGNDDIVVYFELVRRNSSQAETLIATSEVSDLITSKDGFEIHATNVTNMDLVSSDRLLFKLYVNVGGAGPDNELTLYQEGTTNAHGSAPSLTATFSNIFLRQDGNNSPTANIDWGGFDLSNMGKLTATYASTTNITASGDAWFLGNVGIGTESPQSRLTIAEPSGDWSQANLDFFATTNTAPDTFNVGRIFGKMLSPAADYTYGTLTLASPTGANTWIDVLTVRNGKVGIGTTSPSYRLHVKDDGGDLMKLTRGAHTWGVLVNAAGTLLFNDGAVSPLVIEKGAGSTVLYLKNDGNVGIGTASPDSKFQIIGAKEILINTRTDGLGLSYDNTGQTTVEITSYHDNAAAIMNFIMQGSAGSPVTAMTILGDGNVGIGTTGPAVLLDIQIPDVSAQGLVIRDEVGDIRVDMTLAGGSGAREGRLSLYDDDGNLNVRLHSDSISYFLGGNVGIGVIPTARNNTTLQIKDGIGFPASQVASSDANTLDDYEEGEYNPTLITTTSGSYGIDGGSDTLGYVKIGKLVHVQGILNITSGDSPNGQLRMSLPFTGSTGTDNADQSYGAIGIRNHGGNIESAFIAQISGQAYGDLFQFTHVGIRSAINHTHVDTTFLIYVSFSYMAQ